MGTGMDLEISGLVGLLALSLPLAALATVVVLTLLGGRHRSELRDRGRQSGTADAPRTQESAPVLGEAQPSLIGAATWPRPAEPSPVRGASLDEQLGAARHLAASGQRDAAASTLRACLWAAGSERRTDIQAAARLDLGDLCLAAGDTITACEHWQIARGFFSDLKRPGDVAAVDVRMRAHGCPTDWVLNDF